MMRKLYVIMAAVIMAGCATTTVHGPKAEPWRGIHLGLGDRADLPELHRMIKEELVPSGVNVLVLEVNYGYQFASHPELSHKNGMTRDDARALAALCREQGVRLIPQFQCFGHQGSRPNILLQTYPELMAPPNPDYNDPKHYQLSWNPLDPKTNEIVFALIDDLIDGFQPECFHVGLDEVMLFPDSTTPYYNGETHAEVFAKAVNDLHGHVVKKRGLTMLMWGDRLLDQKTTAYSRFESSDCDTAGAINHIPRDIILCDWHYLLRSNYPSIQYFQEQGFRVWPSSWKAVGASLALMKCAQQEATEKMIGHLCTTWCGIEPFSTALRGENSDERSNAVFAAKAFRAVAATW